MNLVNRINVFHWNQNQRNNLKSHWLLLCVCVFMHYRTKTIRRQPIINGGINVEIGNPSYNMYEVGHDHSEGGLLASDFTLNAEKVIFFSFSGRKTVTYFMSCKGFDIF